MSARHGGEPGDVVVDLRWGQDDPAPYLVPMPRVPCVGERIVGPGGGFVVVAVTYIYERGFYYSPTRIVVETEPAT